MRSTTPFVIALGVLAMFASDTRAQGVIRIDMNSATPAIETTYTPPLGVTMFTVGIILDLTGGGGGFPAGVSAYNLSASFDNTEVSYVSFTQSFPAPLVAFGPGPTAPFTTSVGQFSGSVPVGLPPFAGPTGGQHTLGTITFSVNSASVNDDGLLDVTPFFDPGFGTVLDNMGLDVGSSFTFVGGSVVPEPSATALLLCGTLALWMFQRGRHR